LFAVAYGAAAGSVTYGAYGTYFGTEGSIVGLTVNGAPLAYPGHELAQEAPGWTGEQWVLPHVVGPHREIEEQHVYEDIMQLVDWILDDTPTPVTAEHARHVIDIIESAYRSAETGESVALDTTIGTEEVHS
jgi:predicted dehydrogenase